MVTYGALLNNHVANDIGVSTAAESNTVQQEYIDVPISGTRTVNHLSDTNSTRLVQVSVLTSGTGNLPYIDIDFNNENDYIQEDSVSGTSFAGGKVRLAYINGSYASQPSNIDSCEDGTAIESGHYDDREAARAFQNTLGTYQTHAWYTYNDSPDWVGYAFGTQKIITKYTITGPDTLAAGYAPQAWTFQGSNDEGNNWDDLDSRSGETGWNDAWEKRTYEFNNSTAYERYRLLITAPANILIDEIEMMEPAPYYVTTSDTVNLDISNVTKINYCNITSTSISGTNLTGLVSFDGRSSWRKWSGSTWASYSAGLSGIVDSNTMSGIETGLTNWTLSGTETDLDFAFGLLTTISGLTPSIDQIVLNYNERGDYKVDTKNYTIEYFVSSTNITKKSIGTENIKVNILI